MTTKAFSADPWWHVVWVTCRAWPPADQRGDWRGLAVLYARLAGSGAAFELSEPLPCHWQARPVPEDAVELPTAALGPLAEALHKLASSDRVAGGTSLAALAVGPMGVQMLLGCPATSLHQRVGRLKSRNATLLSFFPGLGVGGRGTWGKVFWWAKLCDDSAVSVVAAFIDGNRHAQPG